jgi:hypothetical protein
MNRRPESNGNGKSELNGNGKGHHPIINIHHPVQPPAYPRRRKPSLLPLALLCGVVGLVTILFIASVKQPDNPEEFIPKAEAFRWAVNRAMSAAELTQTARSPQEWQQVVNWWQESIRLMQAVPITDSKYGVAVDKIKEYQTYLQYAQGRAAAALNQPDANESLWGIGSRRAMVIKVQGAPTSTDRYDSLCKELLHYGKSKIELNNGMVVQFEDLDRKFKTTEKLAPPPTSEGFWELGSPKAHVFQVQGTPNRIVTSDYTDRETLYYGDSTVELVKQKVVGYNNAGSLKVYLKPLLFSQGAASWATNSEREEILQVQGTPTRVLLDSSSCSETFYYGNSVVNLKNGFAAGYDNIDRNLRVKVK